MNQLFDMRPSSAVDDLRYRRPADAKLVRQRDSSFASRKPRANRPHVIFSQHGVPRCLTSHRTVRATTLPLLVPHVVEARAEEQVSDVAARRVITGVQHLKPVGDRPVRQLPREPMGEHVCLRSRNMQRAVAILDATPAPLPTVVRCSVRNLRAESLSERYVPVANGALGTGITGEPPAPVMGVAPASRCHWLAARTHGTGGHVRHCNRWYR